MMSSERRVGGCECVRDVTDGRWGLGVFTRLPNIKLISGDVVELWCLLLLDCILQRIDDFAT